MGLKLVEIFRDSLMLLWKEPKVFVPRLITTAIYTLFIFYSAKLTSEILTMGVTFKNILILGILSPILLGIDIVSYGMYPKIVTEYYEKKRINLTRILLETLKSWKILLTFGIIVMIFLLIFIVLLSILYLAVLIMGTFFIFVLVTIFAIIILLVFALLSFFIMPVGILDKQSIRNTLKKGIELSIKYKADVLKINLVFMMLAIITMIIATLSEFSGILAYLAFAIFLIVRLIQAIIYTYISVVNPSVYLKLKE